MVEVNYARRGIDQCHVSIDTNGVESCSLDFLKNIKP